MDLTTSVERLDFIIERYYGLNRESNAYKEEAQEFANLLHWRLRSNHLFGRDCRVDIFGSMKNGLWTHSSDVDICVRLAKDEDIPWIDMYKYLQQIRNICNSLKCERVVPIMCRVPLVKFWKYEDGIGLHGDICFLNELAIYNSDLIQAYSKWEERFVKLGLFLKKWVSICEIGSGEQGYPSSFAWTLMLIWFLQTTEPKVLPNLQKDFIEKDDNSPTVRIMKQGHNIYFHKQIEPNWSKNVKTVGELFIDFLDFYSKFDFVNQIVQIHENEPMSKPEPNHEIVFMDPIKHETRGCFDEDNSGIPFFLLISDNPDGMSKLYKAGPGLDARSLQSLLGRILNKYILSSQVRTQEVADKALFADELTKWAKWELEATEGVMEEYSDTKESEESVPVEIKLVLPQEQSSNRNETDSGSPKDDISQIKAQLAKNLAEKRKAKKNQNKADEQ